MGTRGVLVISAMVVIQQGCSRAPAKPRAAWCTTQSCSPTRLECEDSALREDPTGPCFERLIVVCAEPKDSPLPVLCFPNFHECRELWFTGQLSGECLSQYPPSPWPVPKLILGTSL